MMQLIAFVIFVLSLGGALFIIARKVPALATLPRNGTTGIKKHRVIQDIEAKIKDVFIYFEKQILLHKILSFVKIVALKVETKVDVLLHGIRKKAQEADKKLNIKN